MMTIPRFIRVLACCLAALALSGCIQASGPVAARITAELGGSVWLLKSGVYSARAYTGDIEQSTLVRAIAPNGQRVYRGKNEDEIIAFYVLADGRVIGEVYPFSDDKHTYSYVEIYNSRSFGSYDLSCGDLSEAQRQDWFDGSSGWSCEVKDLQQLLTVLDAARQNGSGVARAYSFTESLPDQL